MKSVDTLRSSSQVAKSPTDHNSSPSDTNGQRSGPAQPSNPPEFPDPIPGIIPFGTLTIVAGAPGVGKTAMLAEWIRRWQAGRTICEKPTNKPLGGFYFLAADRQWQSHQIWFDAVGYPNIPHYSVADDPTYSLERLKAANMAFTCFEDCLKKLAPPPGAHLIVDPVSPLFIQGDPNRARDVATSLLRFSRACQQYKINITCTAHFGKQKADQKEQYARPQDRIAGSGAFSGFSDTQVYLIDPLPPKQPYHILGWVPRHAAPEEFHFKREETNGLFIPYEHYTEANQTDAVLTCVPYEPLAMEALVKRVHEQLGYSVRTTERYLKQLVADGRVTKVRRGVYQRAAA